MITVNEELIKQEYEDCKYKAIALFNKKLPRKDVKRALKYHNYFVYCTNLYGRKIASVKLTELTREVKV